MRSRVRYRRAGSLALAFVLLMLAFGGNATLADGLPATSTSLSIDPSATIWDQPVTFTAMVVCQTDLGAGCGPPSGSVTFMDGDLALGTSPVDDAGQATLSLSDLHPGNHSITAVYGGDTNFDASTSDAASLTVGTQINVLHTFSLGRLTFVSLQVEDFDGVNVSSPLIGVTARCIVADSGSVPTDCGASAETLDKPFTLVRRFSRTQKAYRYTADSSICTAGKTTCYLLVQVDGDPALHAIPFAAR